MSNVRFFNVRLIRRIVVYFTALILLLVSIAAALLGTESGSRITVSLINKYAAPYVHIDAVDGILLRDFNLQGVTSEPTDTVHINIEHVHVRWRPWQLLRQQLHIRQLMLSGIAIFIAEDETPAEPMQWSLELPNIEVPLDIRFDDISLHQLYLNEEQAFARAEFRGRFEDHELRVHHLELEHSQVQLQARVRATLQSSYPLSIEAYALTEQEPFGHIDLRLEMNGSIQEQLAVQLETSGGISSQFTGSVRDLLSGEPQWTFSARLFELHHPDVNAQLEEFVVQFDGSGGLDHAIGDLLFSGFSDQHGRITLTANGRFSEARAELSEFSIIASEYGFEASVRGYGDITPEHVTIMMEGDGALQDYPDFQLQLNYDGDFTQVNDLSAELSSYAGRLKLNGKANWGEVPEWNLHIGLENLDLSILPLDTTVTGSLSTELHSSGRWGSDPHAEIRIDRLEGNVLEHPISAEGAATFQEETLHIHQLQLTSTTTQINMHGQAAPQALDLEVALISDDLSVLHPELRGSLQLNADVKGAPELPSIALRTQAEDLIWQDLRVASAAADLLIESNLTSLPVGSIRFSGLEYEEYAPISGTLRTQYRDSEAYSLNAELTSENLSAQLALSGMWQDMAWDGLLEQFEWRSPAVGRWLLQNPVAFAYDEDAAKIAPFCVIISSREASICGDFEWQSEQQQLRTAIQIEELSFALLQPWLPSEFNMDGALSIAAQYEQRGEQRHYEAELQLTDTRLALPEQDIEVWLSAGQVVQVQGDQNQLDARISLTTDAVDGGITSVFAIQEPFTETPQLSGEAQLNFESLAIVSIIAPQLQNVYGRLRGNLAFGGALHSPDISGRIDLEDAGAEVPAAGLTLTGLRFTLQSPSARGEPFTLSGGARSGTGEISMTGVYDLDTHIAEIQVQGENFTAMQSREIQLAVSPDMRLRVGPQLMQLRGNLHIPRALVTPPDFEAVTLSSRDTIVVRGDETVWQNTVDNPYDIDLQVSLGDNVQVQAYGFDGRLTGRLRIIEQPGQETTGVGNIDVVSGRYAIYGQEMTIERGRLVYTGGVITNPGLDLRVTRRFEMDQVTVGARVGGSLQEPTMSLFSTPPMQDAEVLSYLILGRGFGDERDSDQNMLLQASLALGMQGGNILGERLTDTLGVDEIVLDGGDTLESTSLFIGKHLSPRLYVRYGVGLVEPVSTFFIRYRLTDFLNFETQTGTLGSGADLFFTIER